ncbi:SRPBCC family protein [Streptomyces flavidovirens]|uniref:SRPBCC family protein n=1 Tax=Streptomyces flavidovirens TaxID=67298 RepID=A0ABW6RGB4_9ACTN
MTSEIHRTRAAITVDAPAVEVYRTLTDVLNWPLLYPWIVHTEIVERRGIEDVSKFWAVRPGPEGGLRVWQSRRRLHDAERRMEFEQLGTVGAIRRLGGEWLFLPEGDGRCRVESHHWFTTDQDPAVTAQELDRHGALQMRTLKDAVEQRTEAQRLVLRVERSAEVPGKPQEVYGRLSAALGQPRPGEREAEFIDAPCDHPDGTAATGRSVRITRAPHTLVLKHLDPPGELALYRRGWRLDEVPDGVRVTSEQLAVARPEALMDGPAETAGTRRQALLKWLGARAAADLSQGVAHLAG